MMFARFRRRVALTICPELCGQTRQVENHDHLQDNRISSLLKLVDAFQAATALSDWEIADRAGVNNRAVHILRSGSQLHQRSAARLFEYLEEAWPQSEPWPLDDAATAKFGTVLTIPVIELLGGTDAMLRLIHESGRRRTKDAVLSWARRSGMPEYAKHLARAECEARGIKVGDADFQPARLTPTQITKLHRRVA